MGMFNWSTENGSSTSVSPDFWIYWAVTVPMTIITLAGWAIWWKFEEYRFDRDLRLGTQGALKPRRRGAMHEVKLPWG